MRKILVLLAAALALGTAGLAAEDRTETIPDPKGSKASRELVYRDDALVEERRFDQDGALAEEKSFDSSSLPSETRTYIREGGRLVRIEAVDGAGQACGSKSYRYDRYGRLLGVTAEGSLGPSSVGMIAASGIPQGTWVALAQKGEGDSEVVKTTVLGYDDAGRVSIVEVMAEGSAVSIEKRGYSDDGLLSSVKTQDIAAGSTSESLYDEKGRLAKRTETPAKGQAVSIEYSYDDSGKLVEELTYRGGFPFSRTFSYSEKGKIAREETSRHGVTLLVVTYIENGRVEELYEDGSVFVKATIVGGRKVKDEFFMDGVLARTREY